LVMSALVSGFFSAGLSSLGSGLLACSTLNPGGGPLCASDRWCSVLAWRIGISSASAGTCDCLPTWREMRAGEMCRRFLAAALARSSEGLVPQHSGAGDQTNLAGGSGQPLSWRRRRMRSWLWMGEFGGQVDMGWLRRWRWGRRGQRAMPTFWRDVLSP